MASWKEQAALAASGLIAAASSAAIISTTDIRAKADLIKSHNADSSSVEASEIARKIRDDIKQKRRDITISGSL
ncbi:hypothetical protein IEE92_13625 [Kocuria sp. cx-116]|uniref:hypothetical protein n=1 Tax=Kocuria sp. cx-116 TaxID=2771378 RepID=UPI00168382FE|nr:hypothetical protein [Kocuria sp. cx-116]MBD2763567.1 hypothetical protein [Kocuria sp. cx-116]